MGSSIVRQNKHAYVLWPISLLVRRKSAQHSDQSAIESLTSTIPHRMKRCRTRLFHSEEGAELANNFRFKVRTLIGVKALRNAKVLTKT